MCIPIPIFQLCEYSHSRVSSLCVFPFPYSSTGVFPFPCSSVYSSSHKQLSYYLQKSGTRILSIINRYKQVLAQLPLLAYPQQTLLSVLLIKFVFWVPGYDSRGFGVSKAVLLALNCALHYHVRIVASSTTTASKL